MSINGVGWPGPQEPLLIQARPFAHKTTSMIIEPTTPVPPPVPRYETESSIVTFENEGLILEGTLIEPVTYLGMSYWHRDECVANRGD